MLFLCPMPHIRETAQKNPLLQRGHPNPASPSSHSHQPPPSHPSILHHLVHRPIADPPHPSSPSSQPVVCQEAFRKKNRPGPHVPSSTPQRTARQVHATTPTHPSARDQRPETQASMALHKTCRGQLVPGGVDGSARGPTGSCCSRCGAGIMHSGLVGELVGGYKMW